jgi:hypothetical protein
VELLQRPARRRRLVNRPGRAEPWTEKLWIYDLRTNVHLTLKQNPLTRADLDEFAACYQPANRQERRPTWSEANPDGHRRAFSYAELLARDKANLDIFWLRDESLEETDNLPDPDVIAAEIGRGFGGGAGAVAPDRRRFRRQRERRRRIDWPSPARQGRIAPGRISLFLTESVYGHFRPQPHPR